MDQAAGKEQKMYRNSALIYVVIIAFLAASIQSFRLEKLQRKTAELRAEYESEWSHLYESSAKASQEAVELYDGQVKSLQREADYAKKQRDKAIADAATNIAIGNKLRAKLAASRDSYCTKTEDTTADSGSEAAGAAIDLFDYVQRRLDDAADGIAGYADQAAIAGRACERSYGEIEQPDI